ncbi:hypothetical protein FA95DRAFT_1657902 [Auriscalpium vulgare]|uniref:Uncharacterized protein n=1 Tax=Auriscalpium vulgare TaxID=40419 RepID=A0ACB8RW30_9AGAM|nr:hypothetical protein FA95DRAFT_1657902 [Auriscalpium vulgare]
MLDDDWQSTFQFQEGAAPESPRSPTSTHVRLISPQATSSTLSSPTPSSADFEPDYIVVAISAAFFPNSHLDPSPPNFLITSEDGVTFYLHSHRLVEMSDNHFASYVPCEESSDPPIVTVPLDSAVLNILFHAVYGMPTVHYRPTPEAVIKAIAVLPVYGLSSDTLLAPGAPLFELVVAVAPQAPIEFYAIAASLHLDFLAVQISPALLSYPLDSLTDEIVVRVGAVYLRRLLFLHLGRIEALKHLLEVPPRLHLSSELCKQRDQRKLARAWFLASAQLVWDCKAGANASRVPSLAIIDASVEDVSSSEINAIMAPLGDYLTCRQCKFTLRVKILDLIADWSKVKAK